MGSDGRFPGEPRGISGDLRAAGAPLTHDRRSPRGKGRAESEAWRNALAFVAGEADDCEAGGLDRFRAVEIKTGALGSTGV